MRIVVTGGSGFIGREIVAELLAGGTDDIVVTTRDPDRDDPWRGRVERLQAFAGDPLSLGRAFARADVVVHAIQFKNHPVEDPGRGRTYLEVDGQGTKIAAAAAKNAGVRRFVYLSGAGAGQGRKESWFVAKDQAEAAIRASGLEYSLLRPSWIYGPADHSLNRFVFFCRHLPAVPVIGDGKAHVHPVYVKDVARCAALAVRREDAKDKALELGGPDRLSMDEIIRILQKVLGKKRPLFHQPAALMKLLARPMALLPEPPLSVAAIDFILQEVDLDPKPAMEYFGFTFRRLEEGLREYLR